MESHSFPTCVTGKADAMRHILIPARPARLAKAESDPLCPGTQHALELQDTKPIKSLPKNYFCVSTAKIFSHNRQVIHNRPPPSPVHIPLPLGDFSYVLLYGHTRRARKYAVRRFVHNCRT
jgi:hypothetical protein